MSWSQGGHLPQRKQRTRAKTARLCIAALMLALRPGALTAAGDAAHDQSRQVPPDVQRQIEDSFSDDFVYPDTTEWHFDFIEPYPGSNGIVCGTVNYQNAMRHYVGARHFYALMGEGRVRTTGIDLGEEEDRTGEAAFKMKTFCHLP